MITIKKTEVEIHEPVATVFVRVPHLVRVGHDLVDVIAEHTKTFDALGKVGSWRMIRVAQKFKIEICHRAIS